MTLNSFKEKWKDDIKKGIVVIVSENYIIADRFDESNGTFLCERPHLNKIQADLRNMGYNSIGIGQYGKR
jgi:hypothetical protein